MRILMVISEAPPVRSGVSRVAEKLKTGLMKRGYHVDILSLDDVPRVEFGEIRLSTMPFRLGELKHRLKEYDLIHLHGPVPTFSDIFLINGLRGLGNRQPRLVYTYHAPIELKAGIFQPFLWLYNALQERLSCLADHVVVSTPSYAQRLSRFVPAEKLSVIPWGVDYSQFESSVQKSDPFTIIYLGQIRPYKGLPVLLNAVQGLRNTRTWVIGDGHFAKACMQQAQALKLNNVRFWGRLPDAEMVRLLKQAHTLVLPSITRSEAFGIVLLEGMAAGLVPVASHLPGVADLVGNEGFTFPPGNSRALNKVLARIRDDSALRRHVAGLAQAKARLYTWDRSVFGYERIFQQLVSTPLNQAITRPVPSENVVNFPGS